MIVRLMSVLGFDVLVFSLRLQLKFVTIVTILGHVLWYECVGLPLKTYNTALTVQMSSHCRRYWCRTTVGASVRL